MTTKRKVNDFFVLCAAEKTYNSKLFPFSSLFVQAFPDNAVRREVEHLPASCINESCTWKGSIKEYEVSQPCGLYTPTVS